jgi:hypothetical protein
MVACPFQTLCSVEPVGEQPPFLLAASGPILSSFDLKDGSLMNQWPTDQNGGEDYTTTTTDGGEESRPTKRQKLENDHPSELHREDSDDSIEIISERKKGERRRPKVESSKLATVSHILASRDGKTAIVVTGEDKTITVFDIVNGGKLSQKSRRLVHPLPVLNLCHSAVIGPCRKEYVPLSSPPTSRTCWSETSSETSICCHCILLRVGCLRNFDNMSSQNRSHRLQRN